MLRVGLELIFVISLIKIHLILTINLINRILIIPMKHFFMRQNGFFGQIKQTEFDQNELKGGTTQQTKTEAAE